MSKIIPKIMKRGASPKPIWMEREERVVIGTARMGQRVILKIGTSDPPRCTSLTGNDA